MSQQFLSDPDFIKSGYVSRHMWLMSALLFVCSYKWPSVKQEKQKTGLKNKNIQFVFLKHVDALRQ